MRQALELIVEQILYGSSNKQRRINWDARGVGSTPNQVDISYFGYIRPMTYNSFRSIARKGNWDERTIPFILEKMENGEPICPPFLEVEWDDKSKILKAYGHEGRSRSDASKQFAPDQDIPVHIFVRGKRARNLTDEIKNAPIMSEDGGKVVTPTSSEVSNF